MKKLYWKPTKIIWQIHIVIAIIAVLGMFSVEVFKQKIKRRWYREKLIAARIMESGMKTIKDYRIENIGPIDKEVDPFETGMIGHLISPITSNSGVLDAKIATVNPNWAAVMVSHLKRAGVEKGDTIAAGFSGSFPSLNLATMAAAEALKLKVIAISSTAASTWGANIPSLSWLDMERILFEHKVISNTSVAASLGGTKDRAVGMGKTGRALLKDIIDRNKKLFIFEKDESDNLTSRMEIYQSHAGEKIIKAFVNVGGGTISVGTKIGKRLYRPGLNKRPSPKALSIDSVMSRFAREDVPVIHMTKIRMQAERFGIPYEMKKRPKPGEGALFSSYQYNKTLVVIVLIILVLALYLFIKMGYGYVIFSGNHQTASKHEPPEPMV